MGISPARAIVSPSRSEMKLHGIFAIGKLIREGGHRVSLSAIKGRVFRIGDGHLAGPCDSLSIRKALIGKPRIAVGIGVRGSRAGFNAYRLSRWCGLSGCRRRNSGRGPVRRGEVGAFLQDKRIGRDGPGKHNRVAASMAESRLERRRWGSVYLEGGSEAEFVGGRDGHLDFGGQ